MPDVGSAFDQFAGGVRAVLGLTRHSRLRSQIRETLDLYERAEAYPELKSAAATLQAAIDLQVAQLLDVVRPARHRNPQWGAAVVGLFLAVLIGIPAWLLVSAAKGHAWIWAIEIPLALCSVIFLVASIYAVLQRQPPADTGTEALVDRMHG